MLQQRTGRSSSLHAAVERGSETQGPQTAPGTELVFTTMELHGYVSVGPGRMVPVEIFSVEIFSVEILYS